MKIFKEIKNNIYNKEYYNAVVLNQPLRKSVKYLAKLSLLIALIGVIIFSFSVPTLSKEIKKGIANFAEKYPDDLVVSIKDGNTSINKAEPYIVKLPESFMTFDKTKSFKFDNLITINTTEPFSLEKFREYSTLSLLTKNELILIKSEKGDISITPLSEMGNMEITKNLVLEKEAIANKILPWAMIALIPLAYGAIFTGIFIGTLILLFFYAVIVWAVLKSKGIKVDYKKSYQVALHASTLIIIFGAFSMLFAPLNNVFIRTVILIAVVYFNFDNEPDKVQ